MSSHPCRLDTSLIVSVRTLSCTSTGDQPPRPSEFSGPSLIGKDHKTRVPGPIHHKQFQDLGDSVSTSLLDVLVAEACNSLSSGEIKLSVPTGLRCRLDLGLTFVAALGIADLAEAECLRVHFCIWRNPCPRSSGRASGSNITLSWEDAKHYRSLKRI